MVNILCKWFFVAKTTEISNRTDRPQLNPTRYIELLNRIATSLTHDQGHKTEREPASRTEEVSSWTLKPGVGRKPAPHWCGGPHFTLGAAWLDADKRGRVPDV